MKQEKTFRGELAVSSFSCMKNANTFGMVGRKIGSDEIILNICRDGLESGAKLSLSEKDADALAFWLLHNAALVRLRQ